MGRRPILIAYVDNAAKEHELEIKPKLADGTTLTFFTDTGGGWNAISREFSEKYGWEISQKESENGVIEVSDQYRPSSPDLATP